MAVAQVVVQLHVAQCGKAVEPSAGHGFHGVGEAVFADAGAALVALGIYLGGPGLTGDDGDVALRLGGATSSEPALSDKPRRLARAVTAAMKSLRAWGA